ncbi:hypothetical protein EHF33_03095 [Deinococcus psychrotolerans]|uniref:Serine protease n=1 Tax=Deinococcus psychrotolerans TaxID=2489213 RepID=A0A3G8YK46_9DEIO|nr:trypsin-like peptidase domain-containing protein [Deinococcus psychrotolerans]AZI41861.1 hypothetical protein EHF33_03095 [Deinococcus psychrotolerans]
MSIISIRGIFDQLMLTTTKIVAGDGGSGTGFFYFGKNGTTTLPLLISNRHVFVEQNSMEFQFHVVKKIASNDSENVIPSGTAVTLASITIEVTELQEKIIYHPNPNIDLAAYDMSAAYKLIPEDYALLKISLSGDSFVQDDCLDCNTLDQVIMIGYPTGLSDKFNYMPIARSGVAATIPNVDYNGKPIGVVDIAAFPGSSGSPIYIRHPETSKLKLLGVLFAGPQHNADGYVEVEEVPMHLHGIAETNIPIHLGYYVKAREVKALIRHIAVRLGIQTPAGAEAG